MKKMIAAIAASAVMLAMASCHFISSFSEEPETKPFSQFSLDRNQLALKVGEMEALSLVTDAGAGQKSLPVKWIWDEEKLSCTSDNYGIIVTARQGGATSIVAECNGIRSVCAVNISDEHYEAKIETPYVYCSTDYLDVTPGQTKKVSASMYGAGYTEISGFSFSIDKPNVASIYSEGNYVWVTGKTEGLAKVTARHSKSSFGYSFLVGCAPSDSSVPYITTGNNIVTMNLSLTKEKTVEVTMVNAPYPTYRDDIEYSVVDEEGNVLSDPPVTAERNSMGFKVTALKEGTCYVKASHRSCPYPITVLIRASKNIETSYIEPSLTQVILNGGESREISFRVVGAEGYHDPNMFSFQFSDGYGELIDCQVTGGSEEGKGDSLFITGKKSGTVKITARYPTCPVERSVSISVKNTIEHASSSRVYISTSQNYITAVPYGEDIPVNVTLNNSEYGDENDLSWEIKNEAADGSTDSVIEWISGTGSSAVRSTSMGMSTQGNCIIRPLKAGKATITISHPNAIYSTSIMVNVAPVSTEVPSFAITSDVISLTVHNGEEGSLSVNLLNGVPGDESSLVWQASDDTVSLVPDGLSCTVHAKEGEPRIVEVTVSHPKASVPFRIAVITQEKPIFREDMEDEEIVEVKEPAGKPLLLSSNKNMKVFIGESKRIETLVVGNADPSKFLWRLCDSKGIVSIEETGSEGSRPYAIVKGIKAGTTRVECYSPEVENSAFVDITATQDGIVDPSQPCYLTTQDNVISLEPGKSETFSVYAMNIDSSWLGKIKFENSDPDKFTVSSSANSATVTALKEGTGTITVSHELAANPLKITIHVGADTVYSDGDIPYISTDMETVRLVTNSPDKAVNCLVVHTNSSMTETSGFSYSSSDRNIFTVTPSAAGAVMVHPVKAGQAILKIANPKCGQDKEVLVIIEKSMQELNDVPYLSTDQNVITILQGEFSTVTVRLNNTETVDPEKFTWKSENGNICDISVNGGTTAMVSGVTPGQTKLKVSHRDCPYDLDIIAVCLDAESVKTAPYIHSSQDIITVRSGSSATVTAEMIGGSPFDDSSFIWTSSDSSVAFINGTGAACYIKGQEKGTCYINVRNANYPNAYQRSILVRVEDSVKDGCWLNVNERIIRLDSSNKEGIQIKAVLEGGEPTDGKDIFWWVDDLKVVSLVSTAETADISSTGVSGTTYVHAKHPKALEPVDILVLCSKYSDFKFESDSKSILEKTIYHIPMQVPEYGEEAWIEYESSNPSVLTAAGSNRVAMIAGSKPGNAVVTATLKNKNGVIATSQMAVIIEQKTEAYNTIQTSSTIINLEPGESITIDAMLSGTNINPQDYYAIQWELDNEDSCVLLKNEQGLTKGKNAYITAMKAGQSVLSITHPKVTVNGALNPHTLYVIVPDAKEPSITLDNTYVEMYRGDPSVKITADVKNAKNDDINNILWTAPKSAGMNIISISQAKGKTCTITARTPGATTLRAQLPSGIYADCIVSVLENAEIVFETEKVHVNPGFSETIRYRTVPEGAVLNWVAQMNSTSSTMSGALPDFFSYDVNTATKTITITGKEVGTGKLYAWSAGGEGSKSKSFDVVCDYRYELNFDKAGVIKTEPRRNTVVSIPFNSYPFDMDIDVVSSNEDVLQIKSFSYSKETGQGTIEATPLKEFMDAVITVTAKDTKNDKFISKSKHVTSRYDKYTIIPHVEFSSGSFSQYVEKNGKKTIELGDGEDFRIWFEVAEENADLSNMNIQYIPIQGNADYGFDQNGKTSNIKETDPHIVLKEEKGDNAHKIWRLAHNYDYIERDSVLLNGHFEYGDNPIIGFSSYAACRGGSKSCTDYTALLLKSKKNNPLKLEVVMVNGSSIACTKEGVQELNCAAGWTAVEWDFPFGAHEYTPFRNGRIWQGNTGFNMNALRQSYKNYVYSNYKFLSGYYVMRADEYLDNMNYAIPKNSKGAYYHEGSLCHRDTCSCYEGHYGCKYWAWSQEEANTSGLDEEQRKKKIFENITSLASIHPNFVEFTESRDPTCFGAIGGSFGGVLRISYKNVAGETIPEGDINVEVWKRKCRANTKGYSEEMVVDGTKVYKILQ